MLTHLLFFLILNKSNKDGEKYFKGLNLPKASVSENQKGKVSCTVQM